MSGKPSLEEILPLISPEVSSLVNALHPASATITIEPIAPISIRTLDTTPHRYASHVSFYVGSTVRFTNDNSLWLDVQRVTANVNVSDGDTKDFVMKRMGGGILKFDPGLSSCGDIPYVAEIHSRKVEAAPEYSSFLNDAIKGYCTIDFAIQHGKNETAKALMSLKREIVITGQTKEVSAYMVDSTWLKASVDFLSLPLDSVKILSANSGREQHSKFVVAIRFGNKDVASWIAEQRAATEVGVINQQESLDLFTSELGLLSEGKIKGVFGKVAKYKAALNAAFKKFTGRELPDYAFEELELSGAAHSSVVVSPDAVDGGSGSEVVKTTTDASTQFDTMDLGLSELDLIGSQEGHA